MRAYSHLEHAQYSPSAHPFAGGMLIGSDEGEKQASCGLQLPTGVSEGGWEALLMGWWSAKWVDLPISL